MREPRAGTAPALRGLIPAKARRAVAAMIDIALNAGGSAATGKLIAERLGLPARHLEPVLQTLVRQGLLKSVRGVGGGYELARERRRVTLADIVAAVDGPAAGTAQVDGILEAAETAIAEALARITLEKLAKEALAAQGRIGEYHI